MNTIYISCDEPGCKRHALRIVGNVVQVRLKHDGKQHVSTIAIADLLAKINVCDGALDNVPESVKH